MSKIKFEVEIDATNGQHVLAVTNFLQAIGNTAEAATPAPKQETAKAPAKTAELPKKAKAEEPKKEEPAKEEKPVEAEAPKQEAPKKEKAEGGLSITEVRALLATKVTDNRTEIKNKLTALGASSVTTLEEDKYQEFVDFLNSL